MTEGIPRSLGDEGKEIADAVEQELSKEFKVRESVLNEAMAAQDDADEKNEEDTPER